MQNIKVLTLLTTKLPLLIKKLTICNMFSNLFLTILLFMVFVLSCCKLSIILIAKVGFKNRKKCLK